MAQHLSFLKDLLGKRIRHVARLLYEYRSEIDSDDGGIEIGTDAGVVLLESDSDGESLRARASPWEDPFREPLSEDNRRYVDEHGKWQRVDVSMQEGYADLVGEPVTGVSLLKSEHGRIAGVRLSVPARSIWVVVGGDECHVRWAHPIGFTDVAG